MNGRGLPLGLRRPAPRSLQDGETPPSPTLSDQRTVAASGAGTALQVPTMRASREFEAYRGLAATLIVVYHLFQQLTTYRGARELAPFDQPLAHALLSRLELVDVFFVLSAYLLGLPYLRAAVDRSPVRPARVFLLRRAARIVPLYYIAVLVVWASRNSLPGDWRDLLEHLTFTQIFDRKRIFYTIGPAWSLSLEVIFYLVLLGGGHGLVRVCGHFRARRTRVLLAAVSASALGVGSVAWETLARYALHVPATTWPAYFGPQARMAPFAIGLVLALVRVARHERPLLPRRSAPVLRVLALLVLVGVTFAHQRGQEWAELYYHDIAGLAWGLLIASTALAPGGQRWQRAWSWRPLVGLGLVSYSIYMWHEPILRALFDRGLVSGADPQSFALSAVVVVALSILVAVVSYWAIEYPAGHIGGLLDAAGSRRTYYGPEQTLPATPQQSAPGWSAVVSPGSIPPGPTER